MLIKNTFEVAEPLEKVWAFFGNVPQVAACLPGAELTDDLGNDAYAGTVGVRMGPVKLQFDGKAKILERDDAAKRMVIDAAGADQKGRGQAAMTITANLAAAGTGTAVSLDQDLQLSGAAAQYAATSVVLLALAVTTESMDVHWTGAFVASLAWLILALSVGAVLLLLTLLRRGSAVRVSSLFYLVPPATALEAYVLLGERLSPVQLLGMLLAVCGVAIVMTAPAGTRRG